MRNSPFTPLNVLVGITWTPSHMEDGQCCSSLFTITKGAGAVFHWKWKLLGVQDVLTCLGVAVRPSWQETAVPGGGQGQRLQMRRSVNKLELEMRSEEVAGCRACA